MGRQRGNGEGRRCSTPVPTHAGAPGTNPTLGEPGEEDEGGRGRSWTGRVAGVDRGRRRKQTLAEGFFMSDVKDTIRETVEKNRVVLFMKGTEELPPVRLLGPRGRRSSRSAASSSRTSTSSPTRRSARASRSSRAGRPSRRCTSTGSSSAAATSSSSSTSPASSRSSSRPRAEPAGSSVRAAAEAGRVVPVAACRARSSRTGSPAR